jgi:hypothetical protein
MLIKSTLMAGAAVPIAGILLSRSEAAALPLLDPNDPTAKALGFVTDTTKVNDAANPTHKATQKCGVCAQFQGKAGDATGGCNIFAGHSVPQGGWCKVWAQKPT